MATGGDTMRLAARVDSTQAEIVAALRAAGCSVVSLAPVGHGVPDLLIGRPDERGRPRNWLLECKSHGGRMTQAEFEWQRDWRGQVEIVFNAEQALKAVGL